MFLLGLAAVTAAGFAGARARSGSDMRRGGQHAQRVAAGADTERTPPAAFAVGVGSGAKSGTFAEQHLAGPRHTGKTRDGMQAGRGKR